MTQPYPTGYRFKDTDRTYEVTGWTPHRPGLVEVVIVKSPRGDWPAGTCLLAPVKNIASARVA